MTSTSPPLAEVIRCCSESLLLDLVSTSTTGSPSLANLVRLHGSGPWAAAGCDGYSTVQLFLSVKSAVSGARPGVEQFEAHSHLDSLIKKLNPALYMHLERSNAQRDKLWAERERMRAALGRLVRKKDRREGELHEIIRREGSRLQRLRITNGMHDAQREDRGYTEDQLAEPRAEPEASFRSLRRASAVADTISREQLVRCIDTLNQTHAKTATRKGSVVHTITCLERAIETMATCEQQAAPSQELSYAEMPLGNGTESSGERPFPLESASSSVAAADAGEPKIFARAAETMPWVGGRHGRVVAAAFVGSKEEGRERVNRGAPQQGCARRSPPGHQGRGETHGALESGVEDGLTASMGLSLRFEGDQRGSNSAITASVEAAGAPLGSAVGVQFSSERRTAPNAVMGKAGRWQTGSLEDVRGAGDGSSFASIGSKSVLSTLSSPPSHSFGLALGSVGGSPGENSPGPVYKPGRPDYPNSPSFKFGTALRLGQTKRDELRRWQRKKRRRAKGRKRRSVY